MPDRRYEVRVTGRLSDVAQAALTAADVAEVAAETVISGLVRHGQGLHQFLAAVQSLGLQIQSVQFVAPNTPSRDRSRQVWPSGNGHTDERDSQPD
jgi:hypothetical protein